MSRIRDEGKKGLMRWGVVAVGKDFTRLFGSHLITTYLCFVFFQACFSGRGSSCSQLMRRTEMVDCLVPLHVLIASAACR